MSSEKEYLVSSLYLIPTVSTPDDTLYFKMSQRENPIGIQVALPSTFVLKLKVITFKPLGSCRHSWEREMETRQKVSLLNF